MRQRLALGGLIVLDSIVVTFVPLLVLVIWFDNIIDHQYADEVRALMPMVLFVRLAAFYGFGLYQRLWSYGKVKELLRVSGAVTLSSLIIGICAVLLSSDLPWSIHVLSWFLTIIFIGTNRLCIRVIKKFTAHA